MTKFIEQQDLPFLIPTFNADFDRILGSDPFLTIKGQILFRDKKGIPVLTHIDNKKNSYSEAHYNQLPSKAPYQKTILKVHQI